MSRKMQIYYNTILGGLGALLGWFFIGLWPVSLRGNYLTEAMLIGTGIGASLGAMLGVVEGAIIKKTFGRALKGFLFGGIIGLFSGAVGLGIGSMLFNLMNGGVFGRSVGFLIFGLLLGVGNALFSRAFKRIAYGLIGGSIAGLVGGLIYEVVTWSAFRTFGDSNLIQIMFGAVGMIIVGASLGGITRFTEDLIGKAIDRGLLVVKSGLRKGQEHRVIEPIKIGSYDGNTLYLPGDAQISKTHAEVRKEGKSFYIYPLGQALVFVNNIKSPASGTLLKHKDQIRLGSTWLEFIAA